MIVMALDPSLRATGVVIFDTDVGIIHTETIRTEKAAKKRQLRVADDDFQRMALVATELSKVINSYKPAMVVFETPVGGAKSSRAAISMGMIRGVLAGILAVRMLPYELYLPMECKKAATGDRNASKDAVEAAVKKRYPGTVWPKTKGEAEHCYDAASVLMAAENLSQIMRFYGGK